MFYFKVKHIHSHLYKIEYLFPHCKKMSTKAIIPCEDFVTKESNFGIQIETTQIHLFHHSVFLHAKGLFTIDNAILLKVNLGKKKIKDLLT